VTVQIKLSAPAAQAQVKLYTTAFRMVNETTFHDIPAGTTNLALPLTDKEGKPLANGIYYVVVTANGQRFVGKLLVLQ
jgi:hypothetical protein